MLTDILDHIAEIGSLAGFITLAITILGAISLFVANMGRYIQAKKYGIPIRAVHQANISDSADLWIALAGVAGFGVFAPVIMLEMEMAWWVRFIAAFIAFTLGLVSTKSNTIIGSDRTVKRDGKEYIVRRDVSLILFSAVAILTATAYMRLHNVYIIDGGGTGFFATAGTVVAMIQTGIYILLLGLLLLLTIRRRMFGSGDVMLTEIEGQTYLVAMRHSTEKWILVPCDAEIKIKQLTGTAQSEYKYIYFEKSRFIMRYLAALDAPIRYETGFDQVVERGRPVEATQGDAQ